MTLPPPPGLKPGTEISHFRVEELIARGGMGLVYRATDLRLERRVALKVLSPELSDDVGFRDRFMRESRLAAAVDHPHIIPIHEAGDWNGLFYIAMRHVDGVDLRTVLAASGPPETATTVTLLAQAADALDAAHRAGLVHRDVKPGNLLLTGASADRIPATAYVYLTDFGLTKRVTSVSHLTRSGEFLGSLPYVAPEQIRGEDVGAPTDLYALACVAYEMFTGRPPFQRDDDAGLLWAHLAETAPPLTMVRPDLPAPLAEAVGRGLAKAPADRPTSCLEYVDSLQTALGAGARAAGDARGHPEPTMGPRDPLAKTMPQPRRPPPALPTAQAGGRLSGEPRSPAARERGLRVSGRRWWVLLVAAVLAAAGILAFWRPWSPSFVTRDLALVPYGAELPTDWKAWTVRGDHTFRVYGARDWSAFANRDQQGTAAIAAAAVHDPDSAVFCYVDDANNIEFGPAETIAQRLRAWTYMPPGAHVTPAGTLTVADRLAASATGLVPVGDGAKLEFYGIYMQAEPSALLICWSPKSVYDDWRPTFDHVVRSLAYTG
jgi:tRNA A-37 threonylcarbamoyl transferase component Bud32